MHRYKLVGLLILSTLITGVLLGTFHWPPTGPTYPPIAPVSLTYDSLVKNIIAHHKAPFLGEMLQNQAATQPQASTSSYRNADDYGLISQTVSSQTGVAAAIDPQAGRNIVVTSDSRYLPAYSISTNGGKYWTQRQLTASIDPLTTTPYTFTHSTGAAFDYQQHLYLSTLAGNIFYDTLTDYANFDSQVNIIIDTPGAANASASSSIIDYIPCHGQLTLPALKNCQGQLSRPAVAINTGPRNSSQTTVYVYYVYFCIGTPQNNGTPGPCSDGALSIPAQSSVILEAHATGPNYTFSSPTLVSGALTQTQFPALVIDNHGTPHLFFEDFSDLPTIHMYESTLAGGIWRVHATPVASFTYNGLNNPNWHLRDIGTIAPACSANQNMAYCAFSATAVEARLASNTPDVYLAIINLATEKVQISLVNADTRKGKHHIFPQINSIHNIVYVGWYDDTADQTNSSLAYVVSWSTNQGNTFSQPRQIGKNLFHPCSDTLTCLLFDNSSRLVAGSDNVVHAIWLEGKNDSARAYIQELRS